MSERATCPWCEDERSAVDASWHADHHFAYLRGRADERADVVAWLERLASDHPGSECEVVSRSYAGCLREAAHLRPGEPL